MGISDTRRGQGEPSGLPGRRRGRARIEAGHELLTSDGNFGSTVNGMLVALRAGNTYPYVDTRGADINRDSYAHTYGDTRADINRDTYVDTYADINRDTYA